jgi:uncharacterized membrane protein YhaH (DUF805 family)
MFKNPFSFKGRIRRTEYGLSFIIYAIPTLIINTTIEESEDAATLLIVLLVSIPLLWFIWAQGAKRCHDKGNSGWYQIIPFYVFWLLFSDGDQWLNKYGPNPKGIGNPEQPTTNN